MAQIKDEKQYKAIMSRIDELFLEAEENTSAEEPRLQELDMLSALAEEYENKHYPIEPPTLSETINSKIAENNWPQKEASSILGMTVPQLSAILSGKASPTYDQPRLISVRLNIDPAIVLGL